MPGGAALRRTAGPFRKTLEGRRETHGEACCAYALDRRRAGARIHCRDIGSRVGAAADMVNPTADAVKEQQLLQQLKTIQGRVTIPDVKS